jgi:hypothetical protein
MHSEGKRTDPDRVLAGLRVLLTPKEVTDNDFRRTLTSFPELLTDEAQHIGEAIALNQDTQDAKDSVRRVVSLLQQCRDSGIDQALIDIILREGRERRDARLAELQREAFESRRTFVPKGLPKKTTHPSLGECARTLRKEFPQELVVRQAKSVDHPGNEERFEAKLPRYYFRGEPGNYESTVSSLDRLRMRIDLPLRAIEDILRCKIRIQAKLVQQWNMSPMLAEGFLQHYGMPTNYIDVTHDLDVAVSFASDMKIGDVGRLCMIPLDSLEMQGQLIDLSHHPFAERPARQRALAWTSEQHRNLKDPETVKELGIKWYLFEFTEQDKLEFGPDPLLLDAHSDRAAGTIELAMHGMGKIHDLAACWIADRLQPAPFVLVRSPSAKERDVSCVWVSADDTGIPYEERNSRQSNYERWSEAFPAPVVEPLPADLGSTAADIPIGGIVRVVTSDLFGILSQPGIRFEKPDRQDPTGEHR